MEPARYLDETEAVGFGETHVFVGEDFVVTVRHGEDSDLGEECERLEGAPELDWLLGYPLALALMALTSISLYLICKRRGWL